MAGQHITSICAYDNASEFPSAVPTFAHYLRQMGYKTSLSGKMAFRRPLTSFMDLKNVLRQMFIRQILPGRLTGNNRMSALIKWYHNMESVKEAGMAATTFQIEFDEEVAFFARRKLMDYARHSDTPFCMVASFIHPHDPYVARPEFFNLYQPDEIDMPHHHFLL